MSSFLSSRLYGKTKSSQGLSDLVRYWEERKGDFVPLRSQVDPADFPGLLTRTAIIEAVESQDGSTYRYRLAGTEMGDLAGRDPTGKSFHELYEGDYLNEALALYRMLALSGEPHRSFRRFPVSDDDEYLEYERVILPLTTNGREIDQFLLVIEVINQNKKTTVLDSLDCR